MASQEATQPATQVVVDPRRLGQQDLDLSPEDLADICCILRPNSEPARRACYLIQQLTPEHIIKKSNTVKSQEQLDDINSFLDSGKSSYDIALRLSSTLKFPSTGGFHFGRNLQRCDILIGKDISKRISNTHFRIYINEYGYLMLEDLSTNGTAVDGVLLRANMKGSGLEHQHMLTHGSVVTLAMNVPGGEEDYRFIIRIPTRDSDVEEAYQQNLTCYFLRMAQARNENAQRLPNSNTRRDQLRLIPTQGLKLWENAIPKSLGRKLKEWKGGPKYNKVNRIGKGAFATVYLITSKYDGVPYAAKELEKRRFMKNGILDQKLDDEMKIMQKIKHPNIVEYVEHIDWEAYLYIIMEYVPGGDLGNFVSQYGSLQESNVKLVAEQLLSALKYLHQGGITHRDIKPDNILISNYSPLKVKLTDFGLSKMIESEETFLRTFCGTLLYCAPEVYSEYREFDDNGRRTLQGIERKYLPPQRYGNAVDIWSLAGVLFYSLTGTPPYPVQSGESYLDLLTRIMSHPLDIWPLQHVNTSNYGICFIQKMLHNRPAHRATIDELEKNHWLTRDEGEAFVEGQINKPQGDDLFSHLEKSASQLRIRDPMCEENDSIIIDKQVKSNGTDCDELKISRSFDTSKGLAELLDLYQFSEPSIQKAKTGRLFGEVSNALGSSDVMPLNLPDPSLPSDQHSKDTSRDQPSKQQTSVTDIFKQENKAIFKKSPVPTKLPCKTRKNSNCDTGSSGLFGTESMVGNLHMCSPSLLDVGEFEMIEPSLQIPQIVLQQFRKEDFNISQVAGQRKKRNLQYTLHSNSKRFCNGNEKPNIHQNAISFCVSELKSSKENYETLDKIHLDTKKTTVQNMGRLRSPSPKPRALISIKSGNINEKNQSNFEDQGEGSSSSSTDSPFLQDEGVPLTRKIQNKNFLSRELLSFAPFRYNMESKISRPSKAVLGKLVGSLDSCLPDITIILYDYITSWGRGSRVTIRYPNVGESRIPKYAFKIILFKQNYFHESMDFSRRDISIDNEEQDMSFYISTKASVGIWVNDINLPSYDRQNPNTKSKYWGQLKHGDLITVWRHDSRPKQIFTRFRFECYWGQSKQTRTHEDPFKLIEDRQYLMDLEKTCRKLEKFALGDS